MPSVAPQQTIATAPSEAMEAGALAAVWAGSSSSSETNASPRTTAEYMPPDVSVPTATTASPTARIATRCARWSNFAAGPANAKAVVMRCTEAEVPVSEPP